MANCKSYEKKANIENKKDAPRNADRTAFGQAPLVIRRLVQSVNRQSIHCQSVVANRQLPLRQKAIEN